jgi:DNA-binding transcriptional MerR regulator
MQLSDPELSIGVFARKSRLSMRALRLYEKMGVLKPVRVDPCTGYRWYAESQLAVARLIGMLRALDMPLAQVAEVTSELGPSIGEVTRVLPPFGSSGDVFKPGSRAHSRAAELLGSYWAAIERRIASQRELAAHLQIRISGQEGSVRRSDMFEVKDRDVPEQLVLTEQRHVHIDDMPGWLPGAMQRMTQQADARGGSAGPMFVIYHGEVTHDSDGPVEVCVPVGGALESIAELATRREPAHREVYVRITKAQWEFPQILSAYDAVSQFIHTNGLTATGAPREVYLTHPKSVEPSDELCDVAFPVA